MMSPATIADIQREAARQARREGKRPTVFYNLEDVEEGVTDIPFLGTYTPAGWRLLRWDEVPAEDPNGHGHYGGETVVLFADSSGWGSPSEPALTLPQLVEHVDRISRSAKGLTVGWAIYEAGQMQVNIRAYVKEARTRVEEEPAYASALPHMNGACGIDEAHSDEDHDFIDIEWHESREG